MSKYSFNNGILQVKERVHQEEEEDSPPIALVCSLTDLEEATIATQSTLNIPQATIVALETYQDEEFLSKFHFSNRDNLIYNLGQLFARYEVPIGLLHKLLMLCEYHINIILDDSGSMSSYTDVVCSQAHPFLLQEYFQKDKLSLYMTRFEEEENRLHILIDFFSVLPMLPITIRFMNRKKEIILIHDGKNSEIFAKEAHEIIREAFAYSPASGSTPIMQKLKESFNISSFQKTMHYLFTDGVPTDCSIESLCQFIVNRKNPINNPLTFVSCTEVDEEAEWMKNIEEKAPWLAEVDDYRSEKKEVLHDQGSGFPYTRGLWLMCTLVGAINPYDLDAIDESNPFTRFTLSNLLGRNLTEQEYLQYWNRYPNKNSYNYELLLNSQTSFMELMKNKKSILLKENKIDYHLLVIFVLFFIYFFVLK